jgi:hypothetical protein
MNMTIEQRRNSAANSSADTTKSRCRAARPSVTKTMMLNDFSIILGDFATPKQTFSLLAGESGARA